MFLKKHIFFFFVVLFVVAFSYEQRLLAQGNLSEDDIIPDQESSEIQSILFTLWEFEAIEDARRAARDGQGFTRTPAEWELEEDLETGPEDYREKPPPEERYIRLSGILFHGPDDWIIWLNDKRVTPTALPVEVTDLKVYEEYVEFKWYDDYSKNIYPIRLRPHQRFNIDTRIFLPG